MCSCQREIRGVVVEVSKGCRYPGILAVAGSTVGTKSGLLMIWTGGLIVIILVTTGARVWCVRITIGVAACTIVSNRRMRSTQYVDLIVDGELRRTPARFCRMAGCAICTDAQLLVIRIGRLIEVILMAAHTFHRSTCIAIAMTIYTSYAYMCSRQREVCQTVVK